MNPTNEQELREWLAEYATSNQGDGYYVVTPDDVSNNEVEELQALIAAHTNAEIAKVLDRAKQRFHEPIEHDGSYISISVIDKTFDELIQAERAKLKEMK
jgi:hypothetical protein